MSLRTRIGKFKLPDHYVFAHSDQMGLIFRELEFVPVRVEHMFAGCFFEMTGYSKYFEEQKIGGDWILLNNYELVIAQEEDGEVRLQSVVKISDGSTLN